MQGGGEGSVAVEVQAKEHLLDTSRPYSQRAELNDDTPATLSKAASAQVDLNSAHPSMQMCLHIFACFVMHSLPRDVKVFCNVREHQQTQRADWESEYERKDQ